MQQTLQQIGLVDLTALVLLSMFGCLGLARGFLWQIPRLLTIVAAWWAAAHFATPFAGWIERQFPNLSEQPGSPAAAMGTSPMPVYLAWATIFVGVVVLLSLLAFVAKRMTKPVQITFMDRLSGGVLGVVGGAALIVAVLTGVLAFAPSTSFVGNVRASRAARVATQTVAVVDRFLPETPPAIRALWQEPVVGPDGMTGAPQDASGQRATSQRAPSQPAAHEPRIR